jgi:hypothetical protein
LYQATLNFCQESAGEFFRSIVLSFGTAAHLPRWWWSVELTTPTKSITAKTGETDESRKKQMQAEKGLNVCIFQETFSFPHLRAYGVFSSVSFIPSSSLQ